MSIPLRVLIVEDSEDDTLLLVEELRIGGYVVEYERVDTAAAMQAALQRGPWDIIISDYSLPRFNGLAALELLREADLDIPFILVSGVISEATAIAAMKAGAHDYLLKDNLSRLLPAIERELREAEVRSAGREAEEQLRRLASFPRLNPNPVIELDLAGAITYLNPATQRRFPDLPVLGIDHPMLKALQPVIAELRAGEKDYVVREVVVGVTAYEEHIWHVPESSLIRIYALNITKRKLAEERLQREAARAQALARVAARLNARLDLREVLDAVCEEAARALDVRAASVALYDAKRETLASAAAFGLPPGFASRSRPMPRAVFDDHMRRLGSPALIRDVRALPDLPDAALYAELGVRSVAAAHMLRGPELIGVVRLFTFDHIRHFTEDELALLQGIADQAVQAILNARLFAETERHLQQVQALRRVDMTITGSLDLRVTFQVLLDEVINQLAVDAAALWVLNAQMLEYSAGRGFRSAAPYAPVRLGEGYAGRVALERLPLRLPGRGAGAGAGDGQTAPWAGEGFVGYLGLPLIAKGQVKGVLEVCHRAPLDLDADRLDFLETLARQAAIAIDNVELFEGLQRSNLDLALAYDTTLEGWSKALDLRDQETEGHTQRVTELTLRLARALGLPEGDLVHLRRGALLHDIGKMGIPDAILLKPGPLTEAEWGIMRRHPAYAYEMLLPIAYLRPALDIPYCHHEKWDGTGYPRGLKGEQIPLAARIFAVADVWDALCSDRPYRAAWPEDKVRDHIRSEAGAYLDPQVVEVFLQTMGDL